MDRNKLAIFVNQVGGYDEAENIVGVDAELIARAVAGQQLSGLEQAEIETGFNQLILEPELAFENDIDTNEIDRLTNDLDYTERFLHDVEFANAIRSGVAENKIDAELLNDGATLFANLTPSQVNRIVSILENDNAAEQLTKMFQAYINDYQSGASFWDIEESEFWEWFRDTFYGEE